MKQYVHGPIVTCLILVLKCIVIGLGIMAAVVAVVVPFLAFPMIRHGNPLWMVLGYLTVAATLLVVSFFRPSLWLQLLHDLVPRNTVLVGNSVLMLILSDLAKTFVNSLINAALIVFATLSFTWLWPVAFLYELYAVQFRKSKGSL